MDRRPWQNLPDPASVKRPRLARPGVDTVRRLQCADGRAGAPSIGQVRMAADQVHIALAQQAPGYPASSVVGAVGFGELAGHFAGGEELARKCSFWE